MAVVGAQRVVAARCRRDVDHHRAGRVELGAGTDDLDRLLPVLLVGVRIAQARRGTGVNRYTLGATIGDAKALDVTPLRADRLLRSVGHRDSVLADHVLELKGLPPVGVRQLGARALDHQRRVDRVVAGVRVAAGLVGPVAQAVRQDRPRDAVANRRGRVAAH